MAAMPDHQSDFAGAHRTWPAKGEHPGVSAILSVDRSGISDGMLAPFERIN
jgi:hypothetical protein